MEVKKVLVNSRHCNRAEKQCTRCGVTFYVQPSKVQRFAMCRPCRAARYHPPAELTCSTCARPFTVKGHLRDVQRFCSKACRWNAFDRKPAPAPKRPRSSKYAREQLCIECCQPFHAAGSHRLYCSRECVAQSQRRADELCDFCGATFNKARRSDKKSDLKFCDHQCKGAYFSGPRHPLWLEDRSALHPDKRGNGWDALAEAIRQRDEHRCRRCGIAQPAGRLLDVHHIEPYRIAQNNHPDNLISLCPSCHKIVEHRGL